MNHSEYVIRRYEQAHFAMATRGIPIKTHILSEYLDEIRRIRKFESGLHDKVIIIDRNTPAANLGIVRNDTIRDCGIQLEVRG